MILFAIQAYRLISANSIFVFPNLNASFISKLSLFVSS